MEGLSALMTSQPQQDLIPTTIAIFSNVDAGPSPVHTAEQRKDGECNSGAYGPTLMAIISLESSRSTREAAERVWSGDEHGKIFQHTNESWKE
eukprot:6480674-Amphidinium_carterae.2